jgi:tRNA (cytidine56-2'-O)-methyltransferase
MIKILKLDHRPKRDKRITTHCALVSRAFGAKYYYYTGIKDNNLEKSINKINEEWGNTLTIEYTNKPLEIINKHKKNNYFIIHLTMYGEKIIDKIKYIKKKNNILIIIGGPKVKSIYYQLADYNISITNQPQSEVGALTLILYFLNPNYLIYDKFDNAKKKIIPSKNKKNIINLK